jgi:hypothetical protein
LVFLRASTGTLFKAVCSKPSELQPRSGGWATLELVKAKGDRHRHGTGTFIIAVFFCEGAELPTEGSVAWSLRLPELGTSWPEHLGIFIAPSDRRRLPVTAWRTRSDVVAMSIFRIDCAATPCPPSVADSVGVGDWLRWRVVTFIPGTLANLPLPVAQGLWWLAHATTTYVGHRWPTYSYWAKIAEPAPGENRFYVSRSRTSERAFFPGFCSERVPEVPPGN